MHKAYSKHKEYDMSYAGRDPEEYNRACGRCRISFTTENFRQFDCNSCLTILKQEELERWQSASKASEPKKDGEDVEKT